jgi:hypothetical protein
VVLEATNEQVVWVRVWSVGFQIILFRELWVSGYLGMPFVSADQFRIQKIQI